MITDYSEMSNKKIPKKVMVFGSPSRYIQGPGVSKMLPEYTEMYGKKVFAIIDGFFYESMTKELEELYAEAGGSILTTKFSGEITQKELDRCLALAKEFGAEVTVGIGGGKTLDSNKYIGVKLDIPIFNMPTTASTDAPTSGHAVVYAETGEVATTSFFNRNPDIVLVDSEIIMKAPVRFLVSGMGDALATYFEARANEASDSNHYIYMLKGGAKRTRTGMIIAEASYHILIEKGLQAKLAAESGALTPALEDVIEANILMSGLGFENTGCSGAHAIQQGITFLRSDKEKLHGENVAFGLLVQLVAEDAPIEELDEVYGFCLDVGLPVTLEDLCIEKTPENVRIIAENSMKSVWGAEPMYVDADIVYGAILAADALGQRYKKMRGL